MVSMLEALVGSGRPTWFVHGARSGRVHAMREHVREQASKAKDVIVRTYYEKADASDQKGRDFDEAGLIDTDWIAQNTPRGEAIYYLCGPRPFLRAFVGGLAQTGIPLARIRYEYFGPADELLAA
jgi:nitric oxide dioxygenase